MTDLQKKPLNLAWRDGNTIIKNCHDQEALKKILSEGLYQAISLYTKDTPEQNVRIMMDDILELYKFDDVTVIINAITKIRRGDFKVYGLVTPNIIKDAIHIELEELALNREREHEKNKGYKDRDTEERTSGRMSDFFKGLIQ